MPGPASGPRRLPTTLVRSGNSVLDTGDLSTVTATDGSWSFSGLGTGHAGQKVLEMTPSGDAETLGNAGYTIAGTSGHAQTGLNFAAFVRSEERRGAKGGRSRW